MLHELVERVWLGRKKQPSVLSSFLIDVAAILFWRGVWGLLDLVIFPGERELSAAVSALLGLVLLLWLRRRAR